jgi:hypothetical protein
MICAVAVTVTIRSSVFIVRASTLDSNRQFAICRSTGVPVGTAGVRGGRLPHAADQVPIACFHAATGSESDVFVWLRLTSRRMVRKWSWF